MKQRRVRPESEEVRRERRRTWIGIGLSLIVIGCAIPLFPAARTLNGMGAAFFLAALGLVLLVPALTQHRWRRPESLGGGSTASRRTQRLLGRVAAVLLVFLAFGAYCLFFYRVLDPFAPARILLYAFLAAGLCLSFDVLDLTRRGAAATADPLRMSARQRWPLWRRAAAFLTGVGLAITVLHVVAGDWSEYDPIGAGIVFVTMGGLAGILLALSFTAGDPWRRASPKSTRH